MQFYVRALLPVRHIMWMFAQNHPFLTHPTISICRAAPRCCKKNGLIEDDWPNCGSRSNPIRFTTAPRTPWQPLCVACNCRRLLIYVVSTVSGPARLQLKDETCESVEGRVILVSDMSDGGKSHSRHPIRQLRSWATGFPYC